jgi:hypothetical protein
VVEPAGSGLMSPSPPVPSEVMVLGVVCSGEEDEETADLGDGEGDEAGVGGWVLVQCHVA